MSNSLGNRTSFIPTCELPWPEHITLSTLCRRPDWQPLNPPVASLHRLIAGDQMDLRDGVWPSSWLAIVDQPIISTII
jgi:hypothetical protein